MSDATFQTFLVSGLLVLIASIGYMAWSAWRWVDRERDMEKLALEGVGHEIRLNLKRMISELSGIANGSIQSEIEVVPVVHPQLDALLSRPNEADRRSLTMIRGNYNELSAHKQTLRAVLANQGDLTGAANVAADAVISSIASLYLWEEHKGRPPELANSTRSWDVRDWMKAHRFDADSLPGLHLRDAVVGRLRTLGMVLTPRPLTHTASEFYAMQYDRKADPNAPFWTRKAKAAPAVAVIAEAPLSPDPETSADVEPIPDVEVAPETDPMPTETAPPPAPEPMVDTAPDVTAMPEPEPADVPAEESTAEDQPDVPKAVH